MKLINDFVNRFNTKIEIDKSLVVQKQNRFFLVNESLRRQIRNDFFYAGAYLGKIKDGVFFPSFILLSLIAEGNANKIVVNQKTAWLFVCGRDVFKRGILKVSGSGKKGDYTLILNERNECLGFGKILHTINEKVEVDKVVIANISDIGDFLRREQ